MGEVPHQHVRPSIGLSVEGETELLEVDLDEPSVSLPHSQLPG
jgi:hypothetical protein